MWAPQDVQVEGGERIVIMIPSICEYLSGARHFTKPFGYLISSSQFYKIGTIIPVLEVGKLRFA